MSFAYEHGLRGPRCNGCKYAELKWRLGDKFYSVVNSYGWTDVYELDAKPVLGQGKTVEHDGRPIRFRGGFMAIGHSDECWHFKAPKS